MQCVILAGGRGTRLGSLTDNCPKPLLPVNNKPFLYYIARRAAELGFDNILILTGYRSEDFYPIIGPWAEEFGVEISLSEESTPLGTGGALRNALPKLEDNFLLLNGDTWFGFDWRKLRDGANSVLRMALFEHRGDGRYGNADLRDGVVSFSPDSNERDRYLANGGVYWLAKSLVNEFPAESPLSLESDIFPILSGKGLIEGKVFPDFFIDIGVLEDYARAQELFVEIDAGRN